MKLFYLGWVFGWHPLADAFFRVDWEAAGKLFLVRKIDDEDKVSTAFVFDPNAVLGIFI